MSLQRGRSVLLKRVAVLGRLNSNVFKVGGVICQRW
jgi:hypothetical protein